MEVTQETVLVCVSLRLILKRPDLNVCCLPSVDSQVPIINFCELFMNINSIIISVYSLRIQSLFNLIYLVVKFVPCLFCLQCGLLVQCVPV